MQKIHFWHLSDNLGDSAPSRLTKASSVAELARLMQRTVHAIVNFIFRVLSPVLGQLSRNSRKFSGLVL